MIKIICAFLSFFVLLGCDDKKENQQEKKETLVVATSGDYMPFSYYQNGKIVGFEIDLIHEIGKELGYSIKIDDLNFDSIIGGLQVNRYDVGIAAFTKTPERETRIDFTIPYYKGEISLIVKGDSEIKDQKDLKGQIIGAQAGSTHEEYAKGDFGKGIGISSVRTLEKIPELIQDLFCGRVNAVIVETSIAENIKELRKDIRIITLKDTETSFSIALPKNSPLRESINNILVNLEKKETLSTLKKKWFGID